jgi:lipopolysaccharide/colanic/teichoic acid biosynthesis glycosyltransferase
MGKRLFDILVSSMGMVVASPILLICAMAIKLDSKGPVFYRGERIGRNGKPFFIYKFRSMIGNAENLGASTSNASDVRVTRVGRYIRKYKLDELSQLINVLKGDMSIVGPRPQVKWAVDLFTEEEKKILRLRPGLTDWASIRFNNEEEIIEKSGYSNADEAYMKLIHPEKMRLQLKYLHERSFLTDLRIVRDTAGMLLRTRMKFGEKNTHHEMKA